MSRGRPISVESSPSCKREPSQTFWMARRTQLPLPRSIAPATRMAPFGPVAPVFLGWIRGSGLCEQPSYSPGPTVLAANRASFGILTASGPSTAARWFPAGSPHVFSPTFLAAWGPNAEWPGASSLHPGGINIGLADGSVRFVAQTIVYDTWIKLNGISDGHAAGDY